MTCSVPEYLCRLLRLWNPCLNCMVWRELLSTRNHQEVFAPPAQVSSAT